ncbi:MAG: biotin--[acetyl-CoA-carboxylase] ligase [Leptospiraceae bacterium]|nr:biotin--[acetyl-CoA-carboxylase] ligase [Leptospiraceae bacterium]
MNLQLLEYSKKIKLHTVDSTSKYAAENSVEAGSWVIADEQTAGRGRGSKTWHSEGDEKVIFSGKIRIENPLQPLSIFPLLVGYYTLLCIEEVFGKNETLSLKWPNDIYSGKKKLAGILIDSSLQHKQYTIIMGIGINIYGKILTENTGNATYLLTEPPFDAWKETFYKTLIDYLNRATLLLYENTESLNILSEIYERSYLTGKSVRYKLNGLLSEAKVKGYTKAGFLIVESAGQKEILMDTMPEFEVLS